MNVIDQMLQMLFSGAPGRHIITLLISVWCCATQTPALAIAAPVDQWDQIQRGGTEALDKNEYWIADPMLNQALTLARNFGPADLRLAKSLNELGRLYTIRGRFAEAEPYLEEALVVTEQAIGKENGQTIPAMGSLARFYVTHGTAGKAVPLTEELLSFVEGTLKDPTAQTRVKVTLKKGVPLQGWAGTAAPVVRDPLIEWAIACDDLGNTYKSAGSFDLAERLFKAALDLKSTVLGKEHLSLANSYDNLGGLFLAKDQDELAETYLKDALQITERILPPESHEVFSRLDKLAKCLIKRGKIEQAEALYLRAQTFWKLEPSKYGDDARALFALGCLYIDQKKDYAAAAPVLQKALELAERFNGPSSAVIVPYLEKYAYALYYLGRKPEVDQLRARANTISGVIQ